MSYSPIDFHFGHHDGTNLGAHPDNNMAGAGRAVSAHSRSITRKTISSSSISSESREVGRENVVSPNVFSPSTHGSATIVGDQWSNSSHISNEKNLKSPCVHEVSLQDGESGSVSSGSSNHLNGGSWTVEIISFTIALFSLAAVIGVLAHYNGKSMPSWPTGMTLNTLIALLTAIANAALASPLQQGLSQLKWINFKRESRPLTDMEAFDDASRGIWGSIKLLVMGRGGVLGSFGAVIVILALAMSPFAQQIVVYRAREDVATSNPHSSINAALNYTWVLPGDPSSQSPQFVPILPMKAAVWGGLFAADINPVPPYDCPTGNCTWPDFSTLAVCSSCVSMTEFMQRDCNNNGNSSDCGWSLPNGAKLNGSSSVFSMTPAIPSTTGDMSYATIMKLTFMGTEAQNKETTNQLTGSGIVQPWAQQCTLQYCVQDMHTYVKNGRLGQNVTATHHNSSVVSINETLKAGNDTPLYITSKLNDATFNVGGSVMLGIQQWFADLFKTGSATREDISKTESNIVVNLTVGVSSGMTSFTSDVVQGFYWFYYEYPTGLPDLSDGLAKTMTNAIRASGGGVPVLGTAYEMSTYVHIRWGWIALPAIVVLMTGAFLAAAMLRSRTTRTTLWKSSALAMLFHGLDVDTRKMALDSHSLRQVKVRLDDEGGNSQGEGGRLLRI